jgi:thermostable 8-oxoguanine DNA glycosylase
MVDPKNITDFNRDDAALEEFAIFAILVAGKTATVVAKQLEKLLEPGRNRYRYFSPLFYLGSWEKTELENQLILHGIGCHRMKAGAIVGLWRAFQYNGLDLRTCTPMDLEEIKGIGSKTSRFFILHSRKDARYAALDTHILKGLAALGHAVPKATPSSKRKYAELECCFLAEAYKQGKTPAVLDLEWWRLYSGN